MPTDPAGPGALRFTTRTPRVAVDIARLNPRPDWVIVASVYELAAYDVTTNKRQWTNPAVSAENLISTIVQTRSGIVLINSAGSGGTQVEAFNGTTGQQLWSVNANPNSTSGNGWFHLFADSVVATNGDGDPRSIRGYDVQNGSPVYVTDPKGPTGLLMVIGYNDKFIVGTGYDGNLRLFDGRTGQQLWVSAHNHSLDGGTSNVVFSTDETVFVVYTENSNLYAFDVANGAVLWSALNVTLSQVGTPGIIPFASVYCVVMDPLPNSVGNGVLIAAYEARTGVQKFVINTTDGWSVLEATTTHVLLLASSAFTPQFFMQRFSLDFETGALTMLWNATLPQQALTPIVMRSAAGEEYIATVGPQVLGIGRADGEIRWNFTARDVCGAPLRVGNLAVVSCNDEFVYGLQP